MGGSLSVRPTLNSWGEPPGVRGVRFTGAADGGVQTFGDHSVGVCSPSEANHFTEWPRLHRSTA